MESISQFSLPLIRLFSDGDLQKIHETSLRILEEVGIVIQHPGALKILAQAGADVDKNGNLVKLKPKLVEEAISHAPSQFIHAGFNHEKDIRISKDGTSYTRPISGVNQIIDAGSKRPRKVTLLDVERWTLLANALPEIDVVAGMHPQDVPQTSCDIHVLAKFLQHTDKPIMMSGYSGKRVRWWIELLSILPYEKKSRVTGFSSVNSPLFYEYGQCDLALECARYGIPVIISSPGLAGAQSPATLAGSLAQMNSEILAVIVLLQTAYPGVPVVYAGYPAIFDLQQAMTSFGGPEYGLLTGAFIEMGRSYGLPTTSTGLMTDAIICDQQAGIEKVLAVYLSFLARASIIGGGGTLGQGGVASLEQLVIDDDIFGACRRQMHGIVVNPDTLAFDVIKRIGHEHHFLEDEHTFRYMRSEYYRSTIANRLAPDTWEKLGSKDLWERAADRVQKLLKKPPTPILDPLLIHELERLVQEADSELGGN